jgi:putative transposase
MNYKSYKVEIKPNNKQKGLLLQHCGLSRFVWNWALARNKESYEKEHKYLSNFTLSKELTQLKITAFSWMNKLSCETTSFVLIDLNETFQKAFKNKKGFPKFKKKCEAYGSFSTRGQVHVNSSKIKLPKIGWIRLKQKGYVPSGLYHNRVAVSQHNGRWFVSVFVEVPESNNKDFTDPVGIDLGIKSLATLSTGQIFENPKTLKKHERKLKWLQRSLSRKKKGSQNSKKARYKFAKQHFKVANSRKDHLHKATSEVAKAKPLYVALEDLSVSNMMKNHKMAKAIGDASFFKFRQLLEYKLNWINSRVEIIDRFYPSSKKCHRCGTVKESLLLKERVYECESCGLVFDRDHNAAINILNFTYRRGGGNLSLSRENKTSQDRRSCEAVSMKQEISSCL